MPIATYAGLRERFDVADFTISPTPGGSTTQATSFYYFVYGIARAGINLATAMGQVTVASGEKLQFTVNITARPSGLQPFGFALGVATTNDETQAKLLAIAWVVDSDQQTDQSLPLTIELTTDEDFTVDGTVTAIADLPSNPVNGCIRYVSNDSAFYQWDGDGWYGDPSWVRVYGNQLYLANTTTLRSGLKWKGGCDAPIPNIPADPQPNYYGVISPQWDGEGSVSTPIRLWLLNGLTEGTGIVSPVDSQISLVTLLNENPELASATLSGKIELLVNNFIRRLTGESVNTVGVSATWASGTPFYFLESQLTRGYALEVEFTCSATLGNGDRIVAYLRDDGVFGVPTSSIFLGQSVFSDGNKSLIVPDTLGVKRLSGKGLVVTDNQNLGYFFNTNIELGLTQGIVADTANQQVAISGIRNGAIAVRQSGESLASTEALRAIISTESGTATASDWTAPVTVGANGRIEVAIALPSSVRSNYPDFLIAGNSEAVRAIPRMRVFVRLSGVITELSSVVVESDNDQVIVISDLSGGSVVGSLPSNGDTDFNLWDYGTITPVATGSGSLTAGDYEVAIAWDYPSPNLAITKISHNINDGCIPTLELSLADAVNLANIFSQIQLEGVNQSQRKILDFNTRLAEFTDDPSNDRIRLDFPEVSRVRVDTVDPTVNDDSGNNYRVGDIWINTNPDPTRFFIADSVAVASASWVTLGGSGSGNGITAIADLATLKALTGINNDATYLLKSNNSIYRYDSGSTATADDDAIIIPDDKVNPPLSGRFLKTGTYVTTKGTLLTGDGTAQTTFSLLDGKYLVGDTGSPSGLAGVDPPGSLTTTTTASYTQPEINNPVVINFGSTGNFVENQTYLSIETGGIYQVTAIADANTATAKYLGFGSNPTTQVATNRKVSLSGRPGDNGASSITTTATDFIIPAINSTVVVEVTSSVGINLDSFVNIATAGNFKITAKDDNANPNTITVENLGGNNTAAGVTISAGSQVIIAGSPGSTGSVLATSSITYDSAIPPPSTPAGEYKDFIDATNNNRRSIRLPGDGLVKVYAFLSDVLSTPLTGFVESTATAIADTDSIIEAFQKVQKYLTDFLTTFNGANQLIQLDSNGKIPKIDGSQITHKIRINFNVKTIANGELFRFHHPVTAVGNLRIDAVYQAITGGGNFNLTIEIDNGSSTPVTGLDTELIDGTIQDLTATGANIVTPGDTYIVSASGNSSATDFTATLEITSNP